MSACVIGNDGGTRGSSGWLFYSGDEERSPQWTRRVAEEIQPCFGLAHPNEARSLRSAHGNFPLQFSINISYEEDRTMPGTNLRGKRIAILATDGFEQAELLEPRKALDEAGATTMVVSPKNGKIK